MRRLRPTKRSATTHLALALALLAVVGASAATRGGTQAGGVKAARFPNPPSGLVGAYAFDERSSMSISTPPAKGIAGRFPVRSGLTAAGAAGLPSTAPTTS